MPSGRTIKLLLYELLQFTCLSVPIFVVLERFASLMRSVRLNDTTAYWLVVSVSIAYVTTVTLFIWVPLKFFILKSRSFITDVTNWRPVTLAFTLLNTLPCFAVVLAISQVQVHAGICHDNFSEVPVSLVLFALVCVDIVERIRPYRLSGPADNFESDLEDPGPVLTHLEQVSSVSAQLQTNGGENGPTLRTEFRIGSPSGRLGDVGRFSASHSSSTAYLYSRQSHSGSLHFLWVRDPRHELFIDTFMFWLDTVEMVRVAGLEAVFYSAWAFPTYILAYLSMLRVVLTPNSPVLAALGVLLQDMPFLVLRICLMGIFGYVTPVLYVMKNLLGCLSFVYFLRLTKLKMFKRRSMF
ncbi:transmembrane protein 236 [Electrophorus electricus]|uniref:transmembrane protein 236 n=1 Tax=Electrophorus electricus TaxID=8005 RepID=UPI0015CFD328|nr:transmembrane protein 236 [Electrophorus electricus]